MICMRESAHHHLLIGDVRVVDSLRRFILVVINSWLECISGNVSIFDFVFVGMLAAKLHTCL